MDRGIDDRIMGRKRRLFKRECTYLVLRAHAESQFRNYQSFLGAYGFNKPSLNHMPLESTRITLANLGSLDGDRRTFEPKFIS